MREIQVKNSQGIKVYIDEFPDMTLIPKAETDLLISELEKHISERVKKKRSKNGNKKKEPP